jgi:hypothetical protein
MIGKIERSLPMSISVEQLKDLLNYDPETGHLFWRERPVSSQADKTFNKRFAGVRAYEERHKGYGRIKLLGKKYKAHRVAWAIHHGEWPELQIDHINGVRTDNRLENLRQATNRQNAMNRERPANNMSGVMGVTWDKIARKWISAICVNGKNTYLGCFDLFADAVSVRKDAETEYGFHPNHGRDTTT